MTPNALHLRRFAARILPRVAGPGDAVAITGSVARGNARADSDLDLWILGPRSGRFVRRIQGVSVTSLCQTPADATAFDNLCYYEVDDLIVLTDPSGAFARLQQIWRKQRAQIRAAIVRASEEQIQWETQCAEAGSDLHRATFLRLACWRVSCLHLFVRRGWRVPRLHLLREELPTPLRRRLDAALALPGPDACRRAVARLPYALKEVQTIAGRSSYRLPESIVNKRRIAPEEAAFLARRELVYELLPRVFAQYGIKDLRGVELLGEVAPQLRAAFLALEPKATPATVTQLRQHLQAFRRAARS